MESRNSGWPGRDSRKRPRAESDPLDKLEGYAARAGDLSEEDVKQLRLIIEAYRGWQMLGKATKWLVVALAGLSGLFVALGHIRENIRLWLL